MDFAKIGLETVRVNIIPKRMYEMFYGDYGVDYETYIKLIRESQLVYADEFKYMLTEDE